MVEHQRAMLGGKPALGELCTVCNVGIAVACWQEPEAFGWRVRTAHFTTDNLSTIHVLDVNADAIVDVPDLLTWEANGNLQLPAGSYAHISLQMIDFLRAWRALHETCAPSNDPDTAVD